MVTAKNISLIATAMFLVIFVRHWYINSWRYFYGRHM